MRLLGPRRGLRLALLLGAALLSGGRLALAQGADVATGGAELAAGRRIYLDGQRSDGQPLLAGRAGGMTLSGAEAACVNCHRRSGFGGAEGRSYIPPIHGAALFDRPPASAATGASARPAYTEQTLARALRDGIDPAGRRLDYVMPRYQLSDPEVRALSRHLRQLSARPFAAADARRLDFATVLTPGVPADQAATMKAALQSCFDRHNAGPAPAPGRQRLGPELAMARWQQWQLHVWELRGAPDTWTAQLAELARRQPVFAIVGGIGRNDWRPVHDFCEDQGIPCLFPHLEIPAVGESDYYNLYLSRGLLLEAALIARHLAEQSPPKRVIQVRRGDDPAAQAAAAALARSLAAHGIASDERELAAGPTDRAGQFATTAGEALILWLRGDELRQLAAVEPAATPVYLSATLAGGERAPLAAAWKARALMAYPFELPHKRSARQQRWRLGGQAADRTPAEAIVHGDAEIACAALGIGMDAVTGHLHRDYLVERLEVILGRDGLAGHYPRLSLGAGQRFAAKTGYLVRFVGAESPRIEAVGERIAP